jgi:hypothetical protein
MGRRVSILEANVNVIAYPPLAVFAGFLTVFSVHSGQRAGATLSVPYQPRRRTPVAAAKLLNEHEPMAKQRLQCAGIAAAARRPEALARNLLRVCT